jgi:tripartite-type tricarboxylate transporter receptor subunit TctC
LNANCARVFNRRSSRAICRAGHANGKPAGNNKERSSNIREDNMRLLWTALASLCLICSAHALDYPTKPVRMIVGWPPGGITDVAARILAKKLSEKWGEQVIVENRSGASGMIADAFAARAQPDGYTLMLASSPEITTTPFIQKSAPRYFVNDFVPVALVSINPLVLVAGSNSPYKSVHDLIAAAKAQPGKISYSSPGIGTAPHLAAIGFENATGVKLVHVPYRGGGPAAVAVASGVVPIGFNAMAGAVPVIRSGRVRVLGVASAQRIPSEPNWPTLAEQGVPNFEYTVWSGLFVQKGVPADIVRKLAADVHAVLAQPDVAKSFAVFGAIPANDDLAAFKQRIKRDTAVNEAIVKQANLHQ